MAKADIAMTFVSRLVCSLFPLASCICFLCVSLQYAKLAISLKVPGGGGGKKKSTAAPQGGAGGPSPAAAEDDDYEGGLC